MAKPDETSSVTEAMGSPPRERRRTRARSGTSEGVEDEGSNQSPTETSSRRRNGKAASKKRKLNKKMKGKNDEEDEDEEEDEILDLCELCNINENDELSLICDSCDKVYHTYCLNPPLKEIPPGDWVCPQCIPASNAAKEKNIEEATSTGPSPQRSTDRDSTSPPSVPVQQVPVKMAIPHHLPALIPPPRALAPAAPRGPIQHNARSNVPAPQHQQNIGMNHSSKSSYHHSYPQDRSKHLEFNQLQEQNIYLRRENQKLVDWVEHLTRRVDEIQPLEDTLRAAQMQYRKLESQLLDLQSQIAVSKQQPHQFIAPPHNHPQQHPKYASRPYMPVTLPRVDGRQSEHRSIEPEFRSQPPYLQPSRKVQDYSRPSHEDLRGMNQNHRYPSNSGQQRDAYYRENKAPSNYRPSMHFVPNTGASLPYSQPPIFQKNATQGNYNSYPSPSTYGAPRENSASHQQSKIYHPPLKAQKLGPSESFLPRPPLPAMKTSDSYVKNEDNNAPNGMYGSGEDENVRRQQDNEDDAISALNSMKQTEATSERLNMLTPTSTTIATTISGHSNSKHCDSNSSGKRIGLYTPRSRRLMLDRYLLKRTKRLSRHKWFKYPVRKTLADTRPRVKGRFVKHDDDVLSPHKPESPSESAMEDHLGDFDYIQAFAQCVKESKDDVDHVLVDILKKKQRQGELVSWDSWTMELEQSLNSLLPREYSNSPFPAIFGELVYILGDAEEDCNQENYSKALQAGAIYVAICLSLYIAVRSPDSYNGDISPILYHYHDIIKKLWQNERNIEKKHTFAMMKSIVDGIAGVICIGYDQGKVYLKSITIPSILDDEIRSEGGL